MLAWFVEDEPEREKIMSGEVVFVPGVYGRVDDIEEVDHAEEVDRGWMFGDTVMVEDTRGERWITAEAARVRNYRFGQRTADGSTSEEERTS